MWVVEAVVWVLLLVVLFAAGVVGLFGLTVARVVRAPFRPRVIDVPSHEDLERCPERLAGLERRLSERIAAIGAQVALLHDRRGALAAKADRDELARNYQQDVALLERRAASMQRVLGQVWKTRAILVLRAQLAKTARARPDLGALPDPTHTDGDLAGVARRYHGAAERVRLYLGRVTADAEVLGSRLPDRPAAALVPEKSLAEVEAELVLTRRTYQQLQDDIDRLVDNLTWLGDHAAARAVTDGAPEPEAQVEGAERLLDEVQAALGAVADLSHSVDPTVAAAALANLDAEITSLEKAGMEAQAEADAVIEVDRLLRPATG